MEEIEAQAKYCLNCVAKPCQKGCPLHIDIPTFIDKILEKDYVKAYEIISENTVLASICGRVCPHTSQCEGKCTRGVKGKPVSIGELEAFVGDIAIKNNYMFSCEEKIEKNNKKIAIIGGGPAGLSCGAFLALKGCNVTIYEKHDYLGGILLHGIPEFRLDKKIVKQTIDKILNLGINVKYNQTLGENLQINDLLQQYDAIFISIGANKTSQMSIEGEELNGVYKVNELLEYDLHPDYSGKKVAIIGGGNVALDCARIINKKGAKETSIIYRRNKNEMPAELKEIEETEKEGIQFIFQNNIVKIIKNNENNVKQIECIKTELVQNEENSRPSPVNIVGTNYYMDIDYVIISIGSVPEKQAMQKLQIELDKNNYIKVNEKYQTSNPKIFAGGDLIGEKATIAYASSTGKKAAESIVEYLLTK